MLCAFINRGLLQKDVLLSKEGRKEGRLSIVFLCNCFPFRLSFVYFYDPFLLLVCLLICLVCLYFCLFSGVVSRSTNLFTKQCIDMAVDLPSPVWHKRPWKFILSFPSWNMVFFTGYPTFGNKHEVRSSSLQKRRKCTRSCPFT